MNIYKRLSGKQLNSHFKMRALAFVSILLAFVSSQAQTSEEIIQSQLDYYNDRDIESFISLFHEEATLINQKDGKVLAEGKDRLKEIYSNLFDKSPDLYSTLKNRMVLGNTVIDHESIVGRMGNPEVIELIVIYELRDDRIYRCTVIRE